MTSGFWHSDKPLYQKELGQKIADIFTLLPTEERKQAWIKEVLYIFNHHWDRVDNYRIDKYLMLLRFIVNAILKHLKKQKYN